MEYQENLAWIVLLLPLLAAGLIFIFTRRDSRLSAMISIGSVLISFGVCCMLYVMLGMMPETKSIVTPLKLNWLSVGDLKLEISLLLDPLSLVMLLVVTGVGGLIHIYSWGYMKTDPDAGRYFGGLSLFTFSMLGIVFATNLVMMFIFWELVGVSSYLLIGFWYERASAGDAAKKAFIVNRLGDFGFLLGIFLIWGMMGTVDIDELSRRLAMKPALLGSMAGIAGLLIFCGAMGKSAQFPLHVWLPDAMEGPTPVSALIHAATMVAAGVYMLCRLFFIYSLPISWPESLAFLTGITPLNIIAWIGGITALMAALIAVQQNDIKRILAYSTLSQLGYMVMAVGLANPGSAMFHLTTHAFFKALLFLGAGSVIHALHHEQDIWQMGGLKKFLPITWITFLAGTLALSGVPPFSGFYSKDAILAAAMDAKNGSTALFVLAVCVAALTSFYMFRLLFVAFIGPVKNKHVEHAHESPWVMTVPLVLLSILSAIGGLVGIDAFLSRMPGFGSGQHASSLMAEILAPFHHAPLAAGLGIAATIVGFLVAFVLYRKATSDSLTQTLGPLSRAMSNRFYLDELYQGIIGLTHEALAKLAGWIDTWIISGLGVRGTHGTTELTGRALRLIQTGNLQTYAFLFVAGIAVLLWWKLGR